jgi:hypothetical protein
MRTKSLQRLTFWLILLVPFLAIACGTTYSTPADTYPSGERVETTRDELRATRTAESEMSLLNELIDRARRFRDRMEDYSNPPRYVRTDVDELDRLARDYEYRTRDIQASQRAVDNWRGALDVIDRMKRVLAGENVDIPPAGSPTGGSTYPTYPSYPSTGGTYGSVLSGTALEDFRRTAHEIVVRSSLARDTAERSGTAYSDSERRLLADLSYFVSAARELDTRASGSTVNRQDVRPYVDRLLEDARRLDRAMRDANAYSRVWSDWAEVLRLAQRLSDVVR